MAAAQALYGLYGVTGLERCSCVTQVGPSVRPFSPPAIAWLEPQGLAGAQQLAPGLDVNCLHAGLAALIARPPVQALVVVGAADAQHLAGSRWHVMGDVAREGKVLYVAS